jgi:hypothetical protein
MPLKHVGSALSIAALLLLPPALHADSPDGPRPIFMSPAQPTSVDPIVISVPTHCSLNIFPPVVKGNVITVFVSFVVQPGSCDPPLSSVTLLQFPLPPLPAGSYTVQLVNGVTAPETMVFQVSPPGPPLFFLPPGTQLVLLDAHFAVTATFSPDLHPASGVQLSDASGYFWFFDPGNVELTVKILDGRPVNNHYWVFVAGTTNVAWSVTVTDLLFPAFCTYDPKAGPCLSKTYSSPGGTNQNLIDIDYWADFP